MDVMHILTIVTGVIFLGLSIFQSRKVRAMVPPALHFKWRIIDGFMVFFLVGYLLYLLVQILHIRFAQEHVVTTVFLGGAIFVFLVINVTRQAIYQIRASQRQIAHMHKELVEAYESTVEGWGRALELRDDETEGHTQRVCALTMRLAEGFKLSERETWYLKLGVLLHDIGKMAVPDTILLNQGPLSEEQMKVMQKHPVYAKQLLEGIPFLRPVIDIPYCHHERWDGTGYPRGLKGKEIPLGARIFAVADVWDALISERRYHPAWDVQKVCDHIAERSGSHFDPEVVKRFRELDLCTLDGLSSFPKSPGAECVSG